MRQEFRFTLVLVAGFFAASCGQKLDEPSQTDQALEELKRYYNEALEKAPDDPIGWAKEDIKSFGDWEYRAVSIPSGSNKALEQQLNKYGKDRWELVWVREEKTQLQVLFKRPAKSYLRSVPFSEIGKAFSGDGAGE